MAATFHLTPSDITLLIGTIIPIGVAVVTKSRVAAWVKSAASIALSALVAVVVQISANGGDFRLAPTITLFAVTFGSQLGAYWGFWKPVTKCGYMPLEKQIENFGVGTPKPN